MEDEEEDEEEDAPRVSRRRRMIARLVEESGADAILFRVLRLRLPLPGLRPLPTFLGLPSLL